MNKKPEMKHCSFCDKSETEVKSLIIGPDSGSSSSSISICDECAKLCYEITIAAKSKRQLSEAREETEIYKLALETAVIVITETGKCLPAIQPCNGENCIHCLEKYFITKAKSKLAKGEEQA